MRGLLSTEDKVNPAENVCSLFFLSVQHCVNLSRMSLPRHAFMNFSKEESPPKMRYPLFEIFEYSDGWHESKTHYGIALALLAI